MADPAVLANILEVDPVPGDVAFLLDRASSRAARYVLRRLGPYQGLTLILPKCSGRSWAGKPLEFTGALPDDDLAARYRREFHRLRSIRLLSVSGEAASPALVSAFAPEIILQAGGEPPAGAVPVTIGTRTVAARFASARARDAFEDMLTSFRAALQAWQERPSLLFTVDELCLMNGFHGIEGDAGATWAWTGERIATLCLPAPRCRRLRIDMFLFGHHTPLTDEALAVEVDGRPAVCAMYPDYGKFEIFADVDSGAGVHTVTLRHGSLGTAEDGSRQFGVALHKIRVEAI